MINTAAVWHWSKWTIRELTRWTKLWLRRRWVEGWLSWYRRWFCPRTIRAFDATMERWVEVRVLHHDAHFLIVWKPHDVNIDRGIAASQSNDHNDNITTGNTNKLNIDDTNTNMELDENLNANVDVNARVCSYSHHILSAIFDINIIICTVQCCIRIWTLRSRIGRDCAPTTVPPLLPSQLPPAGLWHVRSVLHRVEQKSCLSSRNHVQETLRSQGICCHCTWTYFNQRFSSDKLK